MTIIALAAQGQDLVGGLRVQRRQGFLFPGDLFQAAAAVADPLAGNRNRPLDPGELLAHRVQPPRSVHADLLGLGVLQPCPLELRLRGRQARRHAGRLAAVALEFALHPGQLRLHLLQVRAYDRDLDGQTPAAQLPVALGLALLAGQRADLRADLSDHVLETLQIRFRSLQAPEGRPPAVLVLADSGRLLEEGPALVGALREDGVDHADLDDRVGVRAQTRVAAEIHDVPQPAGRAVQSVVAAPVPVDGPPDLHLLKRRRERAVLVGDDHGHRTAVESPPRHRALEDRLLHPGAADRRGTLLAQHPANGVADVGLAAPVGSHDRRDAVVEVHPGRVRKRLETPQFQRLELHGLESCSNTVATASPHSDSSR